MNDQNRPLPPHAVAMQLELEWARELLADRHASPIGGLRTQNTPPQAARGCHLGDFVLGHDLAPPERAVLALLLLAYLDDMAFAVLNVEGNPARLAQYDRTGAYLPTVATLLYILGGADPIAQLPFRGIFQAEHIFYRKSVIEVSQVPAQVPDSDAVAYLSAHYADLFVQDHYRKPRFGPDFPAHLLQTALTWDDLLLSAHAHQRLGEVRHWLDHGHVLAADRNIGRHFRKGYRCLFAGPSGTGKTLAATLLGQHLQREVYRVDLSAVISKYIGETSKNLNALFDTAEDKDWVLFFDEGDALFGKRVDTAAADNKNATFANQDVAFLLQRIETFGGVVIVATNFRANMDDAFTRRFQQVIQFELPTLENALKLWRGSIPEGLSLPPDLPLEQMVARQQLSCAAIVNIIQRVSVLTLAKGANVIDRLELERCIKDEIYK